MIDQEQNPKPTLQCANCKTQDFEFFGPRVCCKCIEQHSSQISKYCEKCFQTLILCVGCNEQLKSSLQIDKYIFKEILKPELQNLSFFQEKGRNCRVCGYFLQDFIQKIQEEDLGLDDQQNDLIQGIKKAQVKELIEKGIMKNIHPWCLLREQIVLTNGLFFMTHKQVNQKVELLIGYDQQNQVNIDEKTKMRYFYNLSTNNDSLQSIMNVKVYEKAYDKLLERMKRESKVKHGLNGCQFKLTECEWLQEILEQTGFKLFLHNSEIEGNLKEYKQRIMIDFTKKISAIQTPKALETFKQQLEGLAKGGNKGVIRQLKEVQKQIHEQQKRADLLKDEAKVEFEQKMKFAQTKTKYSGHAVCPGCLFPVGKKIMQLLPEALLETKKEAYLKRTKEIMKNLIIE